MRIVMYASGLGKIQEFREKLRQSLDIFGVGMDFVGKYSQLESSRGSSVTVQEVVLAHISSQHREGSKESQERTSKTEGAHGEIQTSNTGDFFARDTEDSHFSRTLSHGAILAPTATSFPQHLPPSFPHIQSSHGTFTMTSVGGDDNVVDSSRHDTNTNSGNTTKTVTKNSNNDSSVRVRGRAYRPSLHRTPS
jgi:hypothetical protein